jgi:hypothetical protein
MGRDLEERIARAAAERERERVREEKAERLKNQMLQGQQTFALQQAALNQQSFAAERLAAQGQSALGQQGQLLNDLAAFRDMAMASRTVAYDKVEALDERVKKLEALLSKVCVEHEDCCQSLLAHACKKTSDTSGTEEGEKR